MKTITLLSTTDVLLYECHSHWLAKYVSPGWGQSIIASYIAWKVKRKYFRYAKSIKMHNIISKELS